VKADPFERQLDRAFGAARDVHTPSAEEWSRLVTHVRGLSAATGAAGAAVGAARGREPGVARTLLRKYLALAWSAGGVALLGAGIATGNWWHQTGNGDAGNPAGRAALALEGDSVEVWANQHAESIALSALAAQDTEASGVAASQPRRKRSTAIAPPARSLPEQASATESPAAEPAAQLHSESLHDARPVTVATHAQPTPNDAQLLQDIALLSKVEARLQRKDARGALSLLNATPINKLHAHATALRAWASCQQGNASLARALLASVPSGGASASVRARVVAACAVE
jgi:hypothetical protein